MIQANELRIGNLTMQGIVIEIEKDSFRVLNENNESLKSTWFDIEPIPLTEEWLLRFGFGVRESLSYKEYYIGKNEVTRDWLFHITWLNKPSLTGFPNCPFYSNGRHKLFYVHQLQNLYFGLTGEELTIKN